MDKFHSKGSGAASAGIDKNCVATTISKHKHVEELKDYDNTERFDEYKLLLTSDDNKSEKVREKTRVTRGNVKMPRSDEKAGKPKSAALSGVKPEKQHIPNFPWKWDFPKDVQSSPAERRTRRKTAKTNRNIDANVTQETAIKVKELNAQISWIFEESSESDSELSKSNPQQESKEGPKQKEGPFDVKFRDHIMKELLKQGKDVKWFVSGAKKALDNLEKGQHADDPGIKSAVRVSQEVNQFLTKSMRPYYHEKEKGKRTKKTLPKKNPINEYKPDEYIDQEK